LFRLYNQTVLVQNDEARVSVERNSNIFSIN
jgi:hypothetical protein